MLLLLPPLPSLLLPPLPSLLLPPLPSLLLPPLPSLLLLLLLLLLQASSATRCRKGVGGEVDMAAGIIHPTRSAAVAAVSVCLQASSSVGVPHRS
jgi:hypothetical protein